MLSRFSDVGRKIKDESMPDRQKELHVYWSGKDPVNFSHCGHNVRNRGGNSI